MIYIYIEILPAKIFCRCTPWSCQKQQNRQYTTGKCNLLEASVLSCSKNRCVYIGSIPNIVYPYLSETNVLNFFSFSTCLVRPTRPIHGLCRPMVYTAHQARLPYLLAMWKTLCRNSLKSRNGDHSYLKSQCEEVLTDVCPDLFVIYW